MTTTETLTDFDVKLATMTEQQLDRFATAVSELTEGVGSKRRRRPLRFPPGRSAAAASGSVGPWIAVDLAEAA